MKQIIKRYLRQSLISINIFGLILTGLASVFLIHTVSSKDVAPLFYYRNENIINDDLKIIIQLQIFSKKEATAKEGTYCGYRNGTVYESKAKLFLVSSEEVIDSVDLTNLELVIGDTINPELDFYQPWDIDGDGKKQEFIVRTYASCNGDRFNFIRVNKAKKRLEIIPIIHQEGKEGRYVFVDYNKDSFQIEEGIIKIRYYDNTQGKFFKDNYIYNQSKGVLELVETI